MLGRLAEDPFGRRLLRGAVTRAEYVGFLTQSYHYVRWTTPLLLAAAEQLQADRPFLAQAFLRKAREENGHDLWSLRDLCALGVSASEVTACRPSRGVEAYVAWNRMIAGSRQTIGLLGMAYVLERASEWAAGRIADQLVSHSGIKGIAGAVSFLRGHATAAPPYVAELEDLIASQVLSDDVEIVVLTGQLTALSYMDLMTPARPTPEDYRADQPPSMT